MKPLLLILLVLAGAVRASAEVLNAPPAAPDASKRYVFYLHGGVVTGSDGRPVTKEFGPYEYRAILKRFADDGFVVISEIRSNDDDPAQYAKRVAGWISRMKGSGVPSDHISIVGASMGGVIAVHVSALLDDRELSFVILAGLYDEEPERSLVLHGRLLSIYDESDDHRIVPEAYFRHSALSASRSMVTKTGLGHGLIYTARPSWYDAALSWISGAEGRPDRSPDPVPKPATDRVGSLKLHGEKQEVTASAWGRPAP